MMEAPHKQLLTGGGALISLILLVIFSCSETSISETGHWPEYDGDIGEMDADPDTDQAERVEIADKSDGERDSDTDENEPQADGDNEPHAEDLDPLALEVVDVRATSARNIRIIWVEPLEAARVIIERGEGAAGAFEVVREKPGAHERFLDLGLSPETAYRYRLTACSATGCGEPLITAPVETPPSVLPGVDVNVLTGLTEDDVLLFGVVSGTVDYSGDGRMMAIDRRGHVLWEYYTEDRGAVTEVQPMPDSTIMTGSYMFMTQIGLDGELLFRYTDRMAHHDMDPLPDGRLLYLIFDQFESDIIPGVTILGDGIEIMNAARTEVEWRWMGRDHIPLSDRNAADMATSPFNLGQDWTHCNALHFDQERNEIFLNVRNLNRIYCIDYPSGAVKWIMGDGGDFGEGLWSHAHNPVYLDNNRVLLFDNGLFRPGTIAMFTRVIEVAYDPDAKTAEIVWEYREDPDFFSAALGAVTLQANGHILVTDGMNGRIFEINRAKETLWSAQVRDGWFIYKADSVPLEFLENY